MKYLKEPKHIEEKLFSDSKISSSVQSIINQVEKKGDVAVRDLSIKFDNWSPENFRVPKEKIIEIINDLPKRTLKDIKFAQKNIQKFAQEQRKSIVDIEVETMPGVLVGHQNIPIQSVGCYVPGGRYPMVSSAQMSILTAKVAGVKRVIACTPPISGEIPKTTIAAMYLAGADEIYIIGGVQAMTAMALGTETIKNVDMIVGPGNAFVAESKKQLFGRVGIDLFAGPTETLIIADESSDAELVATDIIGQIEHGPTSPGVVITTSQELGERTILEIEKQLKSLPTAEIAREAWDNYGAIIVVNNFEEAVKVGDNLAYEHVQILTENPMYFLDNMKNYGSLFLGPETNVAYGDKVIGTNHILPTKKAARYTGGLWVGKFLKTCTYQKVTKEASTYIGKYTARLCELENFFGHKQQAMIRVRRYGKNGEQE